MKASVLADHEAQALIWDYYKPRHTITWNMLVLSWRELDKFDEKDTNFEPFRCEYLWENFIIRLWLYRTTIKTLSKLSQVESEAKSIVNSFDNSFLVSGKNGLKALRDMIEHFDEYAAGKGRGPAERDRDLDPWRTFTKDHYERGAYHLERAKSYNAAIKMKEDAKVVTDKFIAWYKSQKQ